MPRNLFQRAVFAFITVVFTVCLFVFYNLYFIPLAETGSAYNGAMIFGIHFPVIGVIMIEFLLAYSLEMLVGSTLSFKIASKMFNPRETHPVIFETAIIASTVLVMCPSMSLLATFLYFDYRHFTVASLLATYVCTVIKNFPLAFFGELFIIQPIVRKIFRTIFASDIEARKSEEASFDDDSKETSPIKPADNFS